MVNRAKLPSLVRTHNFPVRLSDIELEMLRSRAEEAGLSASELMRRNALMRPLPKRLSRVSLKTYVELGRIGNNINQLAKAANTAIKMGQPPPADPGDLSALEKLLHQCRREIVQADEKYLNDQDSLDFNDFEEEDDWESD
jgi:hypothetical protein